MYRGDIGYGKWEMCFQEKLGTFIKINFEYLSARFRLIATHRIWRAQDAEEIAQDALLTIIVKCEKFTNYAIHAF